MTYTPTLSAHLTTWRDAAGNPPATTVKRDYEANTTTIELAWPAAHFTATASTTAAAERQLWRQLRSATLTRDLTYAPA